MKFRNLPVGKIPKCVEPMAKIILAAAISFGCAGQSSLCNRGNWASTSVCDEVRFLHHTIKKLKKKLDSAEMKTWKKLTVLVISRTKFKRDSELIDEYVRLNERKRELASIEAVEKRIQQDGAGEEYLKEMEALLDGFKKLDMKIDFEKSIK